MTDTPCDLLKERWYVVGPPWGNGDFIRAGAEDAAGVYVCGIEDVDTDDSAQDPTDVLSYICQIHNAKLREPIRQLALADARADKAEHELAHLRKAYDLLFETHQREMDRLNQKVAELEHECNAYAERDLMIEAALATNGRVEGMDGPRGEVAHVTIPALARVLAVLLIKPDGELYNYVAWDVGELPETGPLTLSLQRGNGKTPAALVLEAHAARDRALADSAALRDLLTNAAGLLHSWLHNINPTRIEQSTCPHEPCAEIRSFISAQHPGAPLLAVLTAASAYRAAVQACDGIADAEQALFRALDALNTPQEASGDRSHACSDQASPETP